MSRVEKGDGWELRLGRYQDVLADVECDAVITDPPYSERVHTKQNHGRLKYNHTSCLTNNGLPYGHWTNADVAQLSEWADDVSSGWICAMTSHDLFPEYAAAMESRGRYVFSPLACVRKGMNVRLAGDGPSNWTCWMMVSRRRHAAANKWGSLPGAYVFGQDQDLRRGLALQGGKPLDMMRAIVRDYSRPGDLVCDPCAGGGTSLLAAITEGRRAIGAECDPATFELAVKRLRKGHTRSLFTEAPKVAPAETGDLFGGDS